MYQKHDHVDQRTHCRTSYGPSSKHIDWFWGIESHCLFITVITFNQTIHVNVFLHFSTYIKRKLLDFYWEFIIIAIVKIGNKKWNSLQTKSRCHYIIWVRHYKQDLIPDLHFACMVGYNNNLNWKQEELPYQTTLILTPKSTVLWEFKFRDI